MATQPDPIPDSTPQVAIQLPRLRHQQAEADGASHKTKGPDQDLPHAEFGHQRRAERADQTVKQDADGARNGNDVDAPAEGVVEGLEQQAGRGAQARGDQQGEENHTDDDEGIVLAEGPAARYTHGTDLSVCERVFDGNGSKIRSMFLL